MSTTSHPAWCALPPLCTAEGGGLGAAHRSAPANFTAPLIGVTVSLHRSEPGWPADTHLVVVISDGTEQGFTLGIADGWRLVDTITGLLEQAR